MCLRVLYGALEGLTSVKPRVHAMKTANERVGEGRGLNEPMQLSWRVVVAIALALAPAWAAKAAFAQENPDAATAGRRLALQLCSGCHFVAPGQRVPMSVNAPPFQAIANDPDTTEFRLRNALRVPHPVMPTLILSPEEVEDVVAYILSLKAR